MDLAGDVQRSSVLGNDQGKVFLSFPLQNPATPALLAETNTPPIKLTCLPSLLSFVQH